MVCAQWRRRVGAGASAGVFAVAATAAAPADEFQTGLAAYHRGDVIAAMSLLRPPARAGHAPSQALLAFILDRADFVDEAVVLYRGAAAQDDADGHAGLAGLYVSGRGVAKDEKLAVLHFSKAADAGQRAAIDALAAAWLKGQLGLDAAAQPAAAGAALQRAAAHGHLPSIDALAQGHQTGRYGLSVDSAAAARWAARGAELRRQRAARPLVAGASR